MSIASNEFGMMAIDYWRLCDEISVLDAALLIVGEDPATSRDYIDHWDGEKLPTGYAATRTALINAVLGGQLRATLRYPARYLPDDQYPKIGERVSSRIDSDGDPEDFAFKEVPDWAITTTKVEDLKQWLSSRGLKTGFFFFDASDDKPDYLDKSHPNYAPKLAAAVEAWQAMVADEDLQKGKTAKQALEVWLRKNADKFGLTKDDGNPNEQGIEDVCKIANWNPKGGAPKTPG